MILMGDSSPAQQTIPRKSHYASRFFNRKNLIFKKSYSQPIVARGLEVVK